MPPTETLQRLERGTTPERVTGALLGERSPGVVGSFRGNEFRIRIARPVSQFYATYLVARVEPSEQGSEIVYRFAHRTWAAAALWVLRGAGALLVSGALLAALAQPVFIFGAFFVGIGTALLLWTFRLRQADKDRLLSFVIGSTQSW